MEDNDSPSILSFPILPLDELLFPFLTKRFLVSISPIQSFREFFDLFPLVGICEKNLIKAKLGEEKVLITYGKIKSCLETRKTKNEANLFELDIEGLGVGIVKDIIRHRPLTVVRVEKLPYTDQKLMEYSFKSSRLQKYCQHFLENNLPFEEDQKFWRSELKGLREIVHFLAMVFLTQEEKWQFLEHTDINTQIDLLLSLLPPQANGKTHQILNFPTDHSGPPPLPV